MNERTSSSPSHLKAETPTEVIVPPSFDQRRRLIEARGGNTGAVRAVTQGDNPDKAHKDFIVAARYAEQFGQDVNQVFKTPELLEQAQAFDVSERKLAEMQTPEAQERRVRELSQAARELATRSQEPEPQSSHIEPDVYDPARVNTSSSRLSEKELRVLGETLRLSDRDIKGSDS